VKSRACTVFVATLLLGSGLSATAASAEDSAPVQSERKLPPLKVEVDRAKVDIQGRRLEVRMSREAHMVRIKVLGESGSVLAEEEHPFPGAAPGSPLVVTWKPSSKEKVARIEVFGYDKDGYYAGVAITPWSASIDHDEVNFETDSAVIRSSEAPKLQASYDQVAALLAKHKNLGRISLYIGGYTDTVGSEQYNLDLSRRRARSISAWFRKRGLRIPIFYEGFGETSPLVKTKDEVDEPRNRRTVYLLSIDPPQLKTPGSGWKKI